MHGYIQIKLKIILDFDTGFSHRHAAAQCAAPHASARVAVRFDEIFSTV